MMGPAPTAAQARSSPIDEDAGVTDYAIRTDLAAMDLENSLSRRAPRERYATNVGSSRAGGGT